MKTLCFEDCSRAILFHQGEDGLVHSEPILDRHRIFVSFVPTSARGILRYIKCCRECGNADAPIKIRNFWKCRRCVEHSKIMKNLAKARN